MNRVTPNRVFGFGISADMTVTDAKHVRITNIVAVLAATMILPWFPVSVWSAEWFIAAESLAVGLAFLLVLKMNYIGRHRDSTALLIVTAHAQLAWSTWMFGANSGISLYYVLAIFLPYVLFRTQFKHYAHGFALLAFVAMLFITVFADSFPAQVSIIEPHQQQIINTAVAAFGLLVMAAAFRGLVDDTEAALERSRERADSLLLNVLPASVAERLKQAPDKAIADRYEEVTILFADIVGFTPLSTRLSARKTVELLNRIFTDFDSICDRAGVEKIRTIGDGYMAVAGAPVPRDDHAEVMTQVAIEMRDYMASRPVEEPLQVRIGINSGEVVAGVIGTTRFHYDLWGDAVNVAARMESLGVPGRIHVARPTVGRLPDTYSCEPRGKIAVKGKGDMETWFVN